MPRQAGAAFTEAKTEAADAELVFDINKLNLHYGSFHGLKDVSIRIERNKIMALIGPSGCGKSTFLRTLNRMNDLIPYVSIDGLVCFDGKDIYGRNYDVTDLRKKVGMVFQKPNPFPKTVFDNITYGPKIHGKKNRKQLDEIVERTLKEVALWDEVKDRLHKPALGLSGGQQQRLCIARCLAVEPEVILMDEPTSALDPVATLKIEELMDGLREKYTIIIVTHNMQQAGRISNETAFFLHGEIVEIGDTETIFSTPTNKKTEEYITGRFG
ncbi:MAG: phosphate ABC transporter ATP-binding protein PstB [Clostridiales Family XIII bacterium]|nr:phosphate ABC transporter ATP-binding protein PstB [Clostridiales Family XIII bacterium]